MVGSLEVPGEAWAELGAAEWPELRKASFATRLGPESWRVGGLRGWRGERERAREPPASKQDGPRCFERRGECFERRGEGSEELLAALGRSRQLEDVDFTGSEIPDAAWELLGDGAWPRLRVAKGVPEEHLERLREASLDLEAGAGEAASSTGSDSSKSSDSSSEGDDAGLQPRLLPADRVV
ncbi:unnamed protein product [Symbiodinium necroappetens]|uniref:Uncharacterized protein n=1 Tax=Symbiodinium necroappetens TaxID=1628268 RepID=A0A812Y5Y6_9DINO|nr:unnamed protein product [Symbiodinium necroappetens]